MTSPYTNLPSTSPNGPHGPTATPAPGAKRARKPKTASSSAVNSPLPAITTLPSQNLSQSQSFTQGQSQGYTQAYSPSRSQSQGQIQLQPIPNQMAEQTQPTRSQTQPAELQWHNVAASSLASPGASGSPSENAAMAGLSLPGAVGVVGDTTAPKMGEDDGEGEDEVLPAMADDDYSAQLSFQSQSKDNLKVLMDNFSDAQYDRFEAYRRHALPKAAVRKVIQQTLGQQVSQPVAQIVAGFAKVFVGEIVEKARDVQERRGETGPLSPDHLREAYRMYQKETGRVGAARPLRAKRLFMK